MKRIFFKANGACIDGPFFFRLELSRFLTPPVVADHRNAPVNALGYLRVTFAVDDIDETLERLRSAARSS